MHTGNVEWLASLRNRFPLAGVSILEIGSFDWNGSARSIFQDCGRYVGVDILPGKGVDVVCKAANTAFSVGEFDVLLALSLFEHDPMWRDSFGHNLKWIKPGGLIFTCWGAEGNARHDPEPWAMVPVQDFLDAAEKWPIEILDRFFEGTRFTDDCPGCYDVVARKLPE